MNAPVLVLDGEERSALAATRALGRRGIPVVVGEMAPQSLAGASRHAAARFVYPPPERSPQRFLAAVAGAVVAHGAGVVMPVREVTLERLLSARETLAPARLAFGPAAAFDRLNDKRALFRLAAELGVPMPRTVYVEGAAGLARQNEAIAALGAWPLVVKPYRSRIPLAGGYLNGAVRAVGSSAELETLVMADPALREFPFLVQEYIDGEGAGLFLLCDGERTLASFAHRRLREKPPAGGVSVLAESVPADGAMLEAAEALLHQVGWRGVAMVEFRVERTGRPVLMEVNARFWGSLQLAVDAGVDFPVLLHALTGGTELPTEAAYRNGVRSRWFLGDLDNLYLQLRAGTPAAAKWHAAAAFAATTFDPRVRSAVFRWRDPAPGVLELARYVRALAAPERRGGRAPAAGLL